MDKETFPTPSDVLADYLDNLIPPAIVARTARAISFDTGRSVNGYPVNKQWNSVRLGELCAWLRMTNRAELAEMIEDCCDFVRVEPDK